MDLARATPAPRLEPERPSVDLVPLDAALRRLRAPSEHAAGVTDLLTWLRGRRGSPAAVVRRLGRLNAMLEARPDVRAQVAASLSALLGGRDCTAALAESGVPVVEGFVEGLVRRVGRTLLPAAHPETDLRRLVVRTFTPRDVRWIERAAASGELATLARHVASAWPRTGAVWPSLAKAIRLLGYRIAGLGLESEVASRMPGREEMKRALLDLNPELEAFLARAEADGAADVGAVKACLDRSEALTRYLRIYHRAHGASLRLTALTWRLRVQIRRLRALLLAASGPDDARLAKTAAELFAEIVPAELSAASVRTYLRDTTRLLAAEVTAHGAHHGADYIMNTRTEYVRFFWKSAAAGVFVSAFAALKLVLPHHLPPFWSAAVYSLNYAACFVLIYVTGSALATKQPAMTASKVAESMDVSESDDESIAGVADLTRRVLRSQLVSFAGNLAVVFPLGYLVAFATRAAVGRPLLSPEGAWGVLASLHPLGSGTLAFAALTGAWLFLTSLVTGYVDNHVRFGGVGQRLEEHPWLGRALSPPRRARLARFIESHAGGLLGNVCFGALLGSTAAVSHFFGLGLDIRHITFSASHLAIALEVLGGAAGARTVALLTATVLAVGVVNFCVSFGLALVAALKARGLGARHARMLASLVVRSRPRG